MLSAATDITTERKDDKVNIFSNSLIVKIGSNQIILPKELIMVTFACLAIVAEDIRFSDGKVFAFFRSWNLGGLLLLRSKLFLLSPAPIQANTRGGDQNMQGIGC